MVQNVSISVHQLSCIDHIFMTLLACLKFFALFSLLLQMFCSVQCGKISPTPTGSAVWITCLTFQPIRSWWPCIYKLCCWMLALYRLLRTASPKEMVQNVSISVHQLSCIDHIFMTLLAVFFALFSLLLQMFCSVQCGKISPTPTGSAVWITCLTFQPIHSWRPCIFNLCCWMLALYRLLRTASPKEMVQNVSISVHKLSCIDHIFMTLLVVFFALFSLLLQMFCSVQCGENVPTPTGSAVWITCLTFQPIHSWRPCIFNLCCWMLALYRLLRTASPKEMVQNVSISVHKLSCIDHIFMTPLVVFFALFSLLLQMFCSVQCGKISPTPTGSAVWITCLTFQPIRSWWPCIYKLCCWVLAVYFTFQPIRSCWPCIYKLCCWVLALYRLLRTALPKEMVQNVSISVHQLSCIDHIFMTLLAVFFCFVFFIVADVLQCPMWQDFSYAYRLRSMNHVSHLPADPFLVAVYLQVVLLGASPLQTATNSIA